MYNDLSCRIKTNDRYQIEYNENNVAKKKKDTN